MMVNSNTDARVYDTNTIIDILKRPREAKVLARNGLCINATWYITSVSQMELKKLDYDYTDVVAQVEHIVGKHFVPLQITATHEEIGEKLLDECPKLHYPDNLIASAAFCLQLKHNTSTFISADGACLQVCVKIGLAIINYRELVRRKKLRTPHYGGTLSKQYRRLSPQEKVNYWLDKQ